MSDTIKVSDVEAFAMGELECAHRQRKGGRAMSCTITLDGQALHRYTKGLMGWGERSSITGERGELVTFDTLDQAQRWIASNGQFSRGAQACGLEAFEQLNKVDS